MSVSTIPLRSPARCAPSAPPARTAATVAAFADGSRQRRLTTGAALPPTRATTAPVRPHPPGGRDGGATWPASPNLHRSPFRQRRPDTTRPPLAPPIPRAAIGRSPREAWCR